MHRWAGYDAAARLRLWPVLAGLAEEVERCDAYEAAILLGSLARGEGDEVSDVDLLLVVRDGSWEEAWSRRSRLSAGALYVWDERPEPDREMAKHAWLTRDFVLVECPHTTRAGAHVLADPFVVVAGDPAAAEALPRRPPIPRQELQEHVDRRVAEGTANEVQQRYDDLARALRRARA